MCLDVVLGFIFNGKIGLVSTVTFCVEFNTSLCTVYFRAWKLKWNSWSTWINKAKACQWADSINHFILSANKDFAFFGILFLWCDTKLLCCFLNIVKDKNVDRNGKETKKKVYLKFWNVNRWQKGGGNKGQREFANRNMTESWYAVSALERWRKCNIPIEWNFVVSAERKLNGISTFMLPLNLRNTETWSFVLWRDV